MTREQVGGLDWHVSPKRVSLGDPFLFGGESLLRVQRPCGYGGQPHQEGMSPLGGSLKVHMPICTFIILASVLNPKSHATEGVCFWVSCIVVTPVCGFEIWICHSLSRFAVRSGEHQERGSVDSLLGCATQV